MNDQTLRGGASRPVAANAVAKLLIVLALAAAAGAVFALRGARTRNVAGGATPQPTGLPRLVDLGAGRCIPCKMMAPILEALKKDFAGKLEVVFIDVWENPDEGRKYGIRVIPTQIFYDASGKELFRHEGFYSREDILAKWKEFGVDLLAGAGK